MAVKSDEFMSGKGRQLVASEELEEGMQLSIKKRWWKVQLAAAASIKYYGKETFIILRGLQGQRRSRGYNVYWANLREQVYGKFDAVDSRRTLHVSTV